MELGLKDKVAIVTGGASGLDRAIVEGFIKEGAGVVIADINLDAARNLAKTVEVAGVKVVAIRTDVTKKSDADNLVSTTLLEFGRIDILVNNAGICKAPLKLLDIEEEEWDRTNDVNAKGVYLVTKAVVPHMIGARQVTASQPSAN